MSAPVHRVVTDPAAPPLTVTTVDEVIEALRPQFGPQQRATRRSIDDQEIAKAYAALDRAKNRVRVYSSAGFVPNSYRYDCQIQYVEVVKAAGAWEWQLHWGRAQRPNARAATVVVR